MSDPIAHRARPFAPSRLDVSRTSTTDGVDATTKSDASTHIHDAPPPPLPPAQPSAATTGAHATASHKNARMVQLEELIATSARGADTAVVEAKFDALTVERGERAFEHALERTRTLAAQGITVVWGFDLDNTLYDTRARTLAIGQDFDRAHGTRYFADIDVTDMTKIARDGASTAAGLLMTADDAKAFTALWAQEFWNPARVTHDVELPTMIARAKAVLAAGGTLRYITGRAEKWTDEKTGAEMSFRKDSLARLERSGLPATDDMLSLKPKPGGSTPLFKRDVLEELAREPNTVVMGFVTDTLSELGVMKHVDAIPCFWVRTTFEVAKKKSTPPWIYSLPLVM